MSPMSTMSAESTMSVMSAVNPMHAASAVSPTGVMRVRGVTAA